MNAFAVALHDVEPATFERCALIRDWLSDLGVSRVALVVVPARSSPELTEWLLDRCDAGDAIGTDSLPALWLDLHPADFDHPRRVQALTVSCAGLRLSSARR